jgi:protein-S-isoprenylcysteine O-methyltransferase Ste14
MYIRKGTIMNVIDILMLICLSLFYLLFTARILISLQQGINPFVLGKGKKGMRKIIELLFAAGLVLWSCEIVFHSLHSSFHFFPSVFYTLFFDNFILQAAGIILIFISLILLTLSFVSFGKSWRVGIDKKNAGHLVTTGIFSMTRNPIFLFIDIYFTAAFFVYPNLFFLLFMILTLIGIHIQIKEEEKFLLSLYGDEYKEYMKKVRRYI